MKLKNNKWKQVAVYFTPTQWLNLKMECAKHEVPMAAFVKKRLGSVIDRPPENTAIPAHCDFLLDKK